MLGTQSPTTREKTRERTALVAWIKAHPVLAMVAIVYLLAWPRLITSATDSYGLTQFHLSPLLDILTGWSPAIAAFTITAIMQGRAGMAELARKSLRWRVGAQWYAVVVLASAAIILADGGLYALITGNWTAIPLAHMTPLNAATLFFAMVALYMVVNTEEIAWRGFALPRLQSRYGPLGASILLWIPWTLFHLPYFFTKGSILQQMGFLTFASGTFMLTLLFTWLFNHTNGSVFLCTLLHALLNTWPLLLMPQQNTMPAIVQPVTDVTLVLLLALNMDGGWLRSTRVWQWLRRIVTGALLLLAVGGTLLWLAGSWAKATLAQQFPPPGQRIGLGGYQMHLTCLGEGSPTVILEAGLNDFFVQWARVQPEISNFTRVCSYDRAGLGWSEPSPRPRTSAVMVEELHTLLSKAEISGPYILVGHSFGGLLVRLFAHHYPAEVLGIVLVDSAHEKQLARIPALHNASQQLIQQFGLLTTLSSLGVLALAPEQIPNRGLPAKALAHYRAVLATTGYFAAATAESKAFYTQLGGISGLPLASLGEIPLVVLSRGQAEPLPGLTVTENKQVEELWRGLQAELAGLSANSRQITAGQSGHYIQLQQPMLVVDATHQLVEASRAEVSR